MPISDSEYAKLEEEKSVLEERVKQLEDENGKNMTMTGSSAGDEKLEKLFSGLTTAMSKSGETAIPVWNSEWVENDSQISFKAHLKSFSTYAELYDWDDRTKAVRLTLTLRGRIRQFIDSLEDSIRLSYDKLVKELKDAYHSEKNQNAKMSEFRQIRWNPEKQSIPQLAALVRTKMKLLGAKVDDDDNEIWIVDRFMHAIREGDSGFASWVELNKPDNCTFKELENFCANKYSVFKHEREVTDESELVFYAKNETQPKYREYKKIQESSGPAWIPKGSSWDQNNQGRVVHRSKEGWIDRPRIFTSKAFNAWCARNKNDAWRVPYDQRMQLFLAGFGKDGDSASDYQFSNDRYKRGRGFNRNGRNSSRQWNSGRYGDRQVSMGSGTVVNKDRQVKFLEKKPKN